MTPQGTSPYSSIVCAGEETSWSNEVDGYAGGSVTAGHVSIDEVCLTHLVFPIFFPILVYPFCSCLGAEDRTLSTDVDCRIL